MRLRIIAFTIVRIKNVPEPKGLRQYNCSYFSSWVLIKNVPEPKGLRQELPRGLTTLTSNKKRP